MQISQNKMAEAINKIARQDAEAPGPKRNSQVAREAALDTQISKGIDSGQMIENVNRIIRQGAEMIGIVEKKSETGSVFTSNARKLVKSGVKAIGAELDTEISKGLFGGQMAENVQKMTDNFAKLRGLEQKSTTPQQPMREVDLSA